MLNPLNRCAVVVTPKQSFFDMLANIFDGSPKYAEKAPSPSADDESTIYLIEEEGLDDPSMEERLAPCFMEIFYEEIESWYTDTSKFPKSISWAEFENYFHISFQSTVMDTVDSEMMMMMMMKRRRMMMNRKIRDTLLSNRMTGEFEKGEYSYKASEILFNLENKAYQTELKYYFES